MLSVQLISVHVWQSKSNFLIKFIQHNLTSAGNPSKDIADRNPEQTDKADERTETLQEIVTETKLLVKSTDLIVLQTLSAVLMQHYRIRISCVNLTKLHII